MVRAAGVPEGDLMKKVARISGYLLIA